LVRINRANPCTVASTPNPKQKLDPPEDEKSKHKIECSHTFRDNSLALLDTSSSYLKMTDSDNDVHPIKSVVTAKEFLDVGILIW
jgi:hypothetical protein